ncbi:MAG: Wzz/FepE/Etk N-terminal domain-containing protein, partial [Caulobacterales bacterium]|nr:Wzz/FepE/Etk N-terminal domain-containing protein [Caulobacterales bacterium]
MRQPIPYEQRGRGEPENRAVTPYAGGPGGLPSAYAEYDDHDESHAGIQFWEILKTLSRRRWLVLGILLIGLTAGAASSLRVTPLYRSAATIEVRAQEARIIEIGNVEPAVTADNQYMATQYALLRSRSLAERVAEVLDLPSDPRYANPEVSRAARLRQATNAVMRGIAVSPVRGSRLISVSYVSPHREESARIANAVAENFIENNLERKYNATAYARRFLEERLQTTKVALEESARQLVDYARDHRIVDLSSAGGS